MEMDGPFQHLNTPMNAAEHHDAKLESQAWTQLTQTWLS